MAFYGCADISDKNKLAFWKVYQYNGNLGIIWSAWRDLELGLLSIVKHLTLQTASWASVIDILSKSQP